MPSYLGSASSGICPGLRACWGRRAHSILNDMCTPVVMETSASLWQGSLGLQFPSASMACLRMGVFARILAGSICVMPWGHQRAVLYLLCLGFRGEHSLPCFSKTVCLCPQILLFPPFSYAMISVRSPWLWEQKPERLEDLFPLPPTHSSGTRHHRGGRGRVNRGKER